MSRAILLLCFCLCVGGSGIAARAQLRTLSQGNADAQWRDAQLKVFDQQLSQPQIPPELKLELEAQRAWLAAWVPKRSSLPAAEKNSEKSGDKNDNRPSVERPKARKEPTLDPEKLAAKHRQALYGSQSGPTAEDTQALQAALAENSGDVGLRQLQMHWIDQPRYRNDYWREISDACGRVISLLEKDEPNAESKLAMAFAYYRKARALCHALDALHSHSDAVAGLGDLKPDDVQTLKDSVGQAASQVQALAGAAQPEFFQLDIYQLRRDQWHGQALQVLEKFKDTLEPSAYLAEKLAILQSLGWQAPANQAKAALDAIPTAERRRLEIRFTP